jgi:hypothetical protein
VTLDGALALIPALAEQQQRIEQKVDRLLAALGSRRGRWVRIGEYAAERGISRDTVERMIDRGELRVDRVRPDTVSEKTGRRRRSLRVWLEPAADDDEIRQVAREMTGPIASVSRLRKPAEAPGR